MKTQNAAELFAGVLNNKTAPKIKLIGDSITHGVGGSGWEQIGSVIVEGWAESPNGYSWANLFRDYMKEKYGATVVNKACTGTSIDFVMKNFSALVESDDDLIVCTIGTNNRHKYFRDGEKPEREAFLQTVYEKMVNMHAMFCQTDIPTILVANIPASAQNEEDGKDYWRILHMCDINEQYKRLADEKGATVLSLYDLMQEYCMENNVVLDTLLSDGLHPNDQGYRVMFELLVRAFGV